MATLWRSTGPIVRETVSAYGRGRGAGGARHPSSLTNLYHSSCRPAAPTTSMAFTGRHSCSSSSTTLLQSRMRMSPSSTTTMTTTKTTKRTFFGHSDGMPTPDQEFTPSETILMDCTGYFIAFALIYVPMVVSPRDRGDSDEDDEERIRRLAKEKEERRQRARNAREMKSKTRDDSFDN